MVTVLSSIETTDAKVLRRLAAAIKKRQMQISLLMIGNAPVGVMVERARLAEAVGYNVVWLADERFYREVYACLAHFAACTSKVLLGPCVTDPSRATRH
jgi:alkanesulfonate monooxygenase SsuD/methylene tetrahydromethanopterin reductase-like flavin-dependent oxidoreductase (luciferase family)